MNRIVFDEPFFGDVAREYLIWWQQAEGLHRGYVDAIAALARAGNLVATSVAGLPRAWFDDAFTGVRVVRVGLDTDLATLQTREQHRTDVAGGLAAASFNNQA